MEAGNGAAGFGVSGRLGPNRYLPERLHRLFDVGASCIDKEVRSSLLEA